MAKECWKLLYSCLTEPGKPRNDGSICLKAKNKEEALQEAKKIKEDWEKGERNPPNYFSFCIELQVIQEISGKVVHTIPLLQK
jgi:hypothetical protein